MLHIVETFKVLGVVSIKNHALDGMRMARTVKPVFNNDDRRLVVVINKHGEILHDEFTLPGEEYYGPAIVSPKEGEPEVYVHNLSIDDSEEEVDIWFHQNHNRNK